MPTPGPDGRPPEPSPITDDDLELHKARAIARLAPGLAHDLVNQVGGISQFLPLVLDGVDERDARMLQDSAERALDTVRALQQFVRTRAAGTRVERLDELVAGVRTLTAHQLQGVAVTVDLPADAPEVEGSPSDLRQAMVTVVLDRLEGMGSPPAGSLRFAATVPPPGAKVVELAIEDTLPAASLAGPDLEVAATLLARDGGSMRHEALPGGGNRFVLAIRLAGAEDAARAAAAGAAEHREPAATTVLICDDDASVRGMVARMLRRGGLDALEADGGQAALDLLAANAVDVVLADHHMAGMSGPELYLEVAERHPRLASRFVLMSGDAGAADLVAFAAGHGIRIVGKPFTVAIAEVARAVAGGPS